MKKIHPHHHHKTSVSLPSASYRRVCAARLIFARNGVQYSDQEIYRRLFKLFLRNWRGRGRKANSPRRYNADGKTYEIHALYINQVLYSALWHRAIHSGESVSRMLDLAIRVYLPRLLENLLRADLPWVASGRNSLYWTARYERRRRHYPDLFINYACITHQNDSDGLEYTQKIQIIPKTSLSTMEIWHMLHTTA